MCTYIHTYITHIHTHASLARPAASDSFATRSGAAGAPTYIYIYIYIYVYVYIYICV